MAGRQGERCQEGGTARGEVPRGRGVEREGCREGVREGCQEGEGRERQREWGKKKSGAEGCRGYQSCLYIFVYTVSAE